MGSSEWPDVSDVCWSEAERSSTLFECAVTRPQSILILSAKIILKKEIKWREMNSLSPRFEYGDIKSNYYAKKNANLPF